jgi:hypothetical protein
MFIEKSPFCLYNNDLPQRLVFDFSMIRSLIKDRDFLSCDREKIAAAGVEARTLSHDCGTGGPE